MKRMLRGLILVGAGVVTIAAEMFAWQERDTYRPPNFEGTFPIDAQAGKRLEGALGSLEQQREISEDSMELFRQGLRTLPVDRQMPAIRWFGNAYVWNKSPQDARAIDLMYHASGATNTQISYNAIYFGLSTVRPMTEPILRALVEAGLRSEDPNVLARIAWGASAQKADLLRRLEPYLVSTDAEQRRHAGELRRIFSGEVKAFAWAAERARVKAENKFAGRLDEIRLALTNGDSAQRREMMDLIQREQIALIMDESFISAFAAAAGDRDAKVRNAAVITVGSQWIWHAQEQSPEAIELMLKVSRDFDYQVRYNANYYGLSTVRKRSDEVVARMFEMLLEDGLDNRNFRQRVLWGLKDEKATTRRVLEKWMIDGSPINALFAYGLYLDFLGELPEMSARVAEWIRTPEKTAARLLAFGPTQGTSVKSADEFLEQLKKELPPKQGERLVWSNIDGPPFLLVEETDETAIRAALLKSPRCKVAFERPLSVADLISLGKATSPGAFGR